ncbi:hypothetical protein ACOMHN_006631 [Nucella lapillus]
MDTAVGCVYHGDRYSFDAVADDLRKTGIIKRRHAKLLAMTVCSCRKKASYRQPISEEQAREAANHLLTPSLPLWDELSTLAHDLVTSSAQTVQRGLLPLTAAASQTRLTVLIHQALRKDFKLLDEEVLKSKAVQPAKLPTNKPKVSKKIVQKIIQKKKRNYPELMRVILPLFGGSTRQLFQDSEVGEGFRTIGRKYACVLEIDREATSAKMVNNVKETVVKAWCLNQQGGREAQRVLTTVARNIQAQSDEAWKRVQGERVRQETDDYHDDDDDWGCFEESDTVLDDWSDPSLDYFY